MAHLPPNSLESYSHDKEGDARVFSPSTGRNKDVIKEVVTGLLKGLDSKFAGSQTKVALEVACGTGEHCAYLAAATPGWTWQPTNMTSDMFASVKAHADGLTNVLPPCEVDVRLEEWNLPQAASQPLAIQCANMCHIAPWEATTGLLKGAGKLLAPSGLLMIYGAFMVDGQHTSLSNADFDKMLKERDPSWGVRDTSVMAEFAKDCGLQLKDKISMPANNFILVFEKE